MATKIIKFDLPINGTKVDTLDALRDNLTDEIVKLARSGQLERWFKSRKMEEKSQAVAHAAATHAEDKSLFISLCEILEVEVHPDDVSAIFDEPTEAGVYIKNISYFRLYEELKCDYENLKKSIATENHKTKTNTAAEKASATVKTSGAAKKTGLPRKKSEPIDIFADMVKRRNSFLGEFSDISHIIESISKNYK